MSFFATYAYLTTTLILLAVASVAFALAANQRRPMLLASLLAVIHTPVAVTFIPRYWNPVRIAVYYGMAPEDVLLLFSAGGILWLLGTWPVMPRLSLNIRWPVLIRRYVPVAVLAAAVLLTCLFFGIDPITSSLAGLVTVVFVLLCLRPQFWTMPVAGGLGCCVTWFVMLRLLFTVFPDFSRQWSWGNLWGPAFWGVPAEELAWALAYGAARPLFMAYVFDARVAPPAAATARPIVEAPETASRGAPLPAGR